MLESKHEMLQHGNFSGGLSQHLMCKLWTVNRSYLDLWFQLLAQLRRHLKDFSKWMPKESIHKNSIVQRLVVFSMGRWQRSLELCRKRHKIGLPTHSYPHTAPHGALSASAKHTQRREWQQRCGGDATAQDTSLCHMGPGTTPQLCYYMRQNNTCSFRMLFKHPTGNNHK